MIWEQINERERQYLASIVEFAGAVQYAVRLMSERQNRYYESSKSAKASTLTVSEVTEIEQRYSRAAENYAELGKALHEQTQRFFATDEA